MFVRILKKAWPCEAENCLVDIKGCFADPDGNVSPGHDWQGYKASFVQHGEPQHAAVVGSEPVHILLKDFLCLGCPLGPAGFDGILPDASLP